LGNLEYESIPDAYTDPPDATASKSMMNLLVSFPGLQRFEKRQHDQKTSCRLRLTDMYEVTSADFLHPNQPLNQSLLRDIQIET
jgi:hypothetical protein